MEKILISKEDDLLYLCWRKGGKDSLLLRSHMKTLVLSVPVWTRRLPRMKGTCTVHVPNVGIKGTWQHTWKAVLGKRHLISLPLGNIETVQKSYAHVRVMLWTSCMKHVNPSNTGLIHLLLLISHYRQHRTGWYSVAPSEVVPEFSGRVSLFRTDKCLPSYMMWMW